MTLARIVIREWDWLWAAIPIVIAALILLSWGYRQATVGGGGFRSLAAGLKIVGLMLLAFFLLDPHWSEYRSQPRANLFFILADNSRSLTVTDETDEISRGHALRTALFGSEFAEYGQPDTDPSTPLQSDPSDANAVPKADSQASSNTGTLISPWAIRLAEQFDARAFAFDTRLRHLDQRTNLVFEGEASDLMTALRTLKDRYRGRPVAGVLLFTDGNATDLPDGQLDLTGMPPIFPVVLGHEEPTADIRIENLSVAQTAFEDAPVTITADAHAHGFVGQSVAASIVDKGGNIVEQQTVAIEDENKPLAFRFQLKPKQAGVSFYRLLIARPDDQADLIANTKQKDAQKDSEATFENNSRLIAIDRGQGPYRVLYVSGRPNWEYKFLSRAVVDDPQLEVVGLIRIARREAKFTWRRKGESGSNPLFQGFDEKKKEDVEQYDEPVLVRMNTKDDAELRNGFPKTADDLFKYHAIIIDDLESGFFTRDQMALIEKFVTRRRGGLMMLGGSESLREGAYKETPIGRMLPVYLDRSKETRQGPFQFELTRAGRHENWVRLRGSEHDEQQRIDDMPGFRTLNTVFGIKPGATTLATVRDDVGAVHPALVVQSFGGRVGVMTVGDQWRWALQRPRGDDVLVNERNYDQARMWRQTLRWLIADVPGRATLTADDPDGSDDEVGRAKQLKVTLRDKQFQTVDNASVKLKVTPPDGQTIEIIADPTKESGVYTAKYLPRLPGAYRVIASATDGKGETLGNAATGWAQNPASDEFQSIQPNRPLLNSIAEKTGGELVDADDLDSFVAALPTKKSPVMEMTVEPLWDRWWVFVVALLCLAGEWGIRRLKGLP